jgi:MFS family permease
MDKLKLPLNFYALIISRMTSNFGTYLNMMALNIFMLELTKSANWIAIIMGSKVISGIIFSPLLGYISDKFNRKNLMIISDLILAFFVFLLVFIPVAYIHYYIIILMALIGIFSNLFDINLRASIPVVLDSKNTLTANSYLLGGTNLIIAISGLIAAFANFIFKNFYSIFILDALTYLISGIVLLSLKIKTIQLNKESFNIASSVKKSFMIKLKEDYSEILKLDNIKIIAICLFVLFLDAIASASHNIGFPLFSSKLDSARPMFYYGLIIMSWGIGNLVGIYFLNKLFRNMTAERLYLFFTALMSLGMILIFQSNSTAIILFSALIAGIGDGTYQTYYTTYVQHVADSVRGKIFAITNLVLRSGFGLGFIMVPLVLNSLSMSKTVILFHLPVIIISILYLLYLNIRKKESRLQLEELKNE